MLSLRCPFVTSQKADHQRLCNFFLKSGAREKKKQRMNYGTFGEITVQRQTAQSENPAKIKFEYCETQFRWKHDLNRLTHCDAGGVVCIHAAGVQGEARQCETEEAGGLHPPCHYEDTGSWISHRQYPYWPQWLCCLSARRWPCLPLESWAEATENQRHVCMFCLFYAAYLTELMKALLLLIPNCFFYLVCSSSFFCLKGL